MPAWTISGVLTSHHSKGRSTIRFRRRGEYDNNTSALVANSLSLCYHHQDKKARDHVDRGYDKSKEGRFAFRLVRDNDHICNSRTTLAVGQVPMFRY